ncbi:MAG: IS66 family transposase, partial [Culicoidibacterales bacterium]
MSILGEKTVHEYVKFIPARVKRMVVKTQTLICRCLEKTNDITNIIEAYAPKLPLPQSIAGPELLAEVFGQKFITSIPLYRQRQFWQRTGLALSDRTLCNWIITAANKWL